MFLNGKELARGHLPVGDLNTDAMGAPYALEAYVQLNPDGTPKVVTSKNDVDGILFFVSIRSSSLSMLVHLIAITCRMVFTNYEQNTAMHNIEFYTSFTARMWWYWHMRSLRKAPKSQMRTSNAHSDERHNLCGARKYTR